MNMSSDDELTAIAATSPPIGRWRGGEPAG
jgi:hypothetical protein